MKFIPYENYYLTTDLTPEEVSRRLSLNIEPPKITFFNLNRKSLYEGYITNGKFEISRIIRYRNGWLPSINGEVFVSNDGKTTVHIVMSLSSYGYVFSIPWFAVVFLAGYFIIKQMIRENAFDPKSLFLVPFSLIGYGMLLAAFKIESRKSKRFFEKVVDPHYLGEISN